MRTASIQNNSLRNTPSTRLKLTTMVGHTDRTNAEGIRQLKDLLEPVGIEVVVAHMPHYKGPSDVFHLMSVLSPVDNDLAVVYSPLMPIAFRNELIDRGFSFVEVPDTEWDSMGCNVLALAPREVLMVKGNPRTKAALMSAGCVVPEYDGQEISVKGGGGPVLPASPGPSSSGHKKCFDPNRSRPPVPATGVAKYEPRLTSDSQSLLFATQTGEWVF